MVAISPMNGRTLGDMKIYDTLLYIHITSTLIMMSVLCMLSLCNFHLKQPNQLSFFTARCYAERGSAMASCLSVRPSVYNVEVSCSHRLEFLENN